MIDFYRKCDIFLRTTLDFDKFGMKIKLPFYFHIKDLGQDFMYEDRTTILEDYPDLEFNSQKEDNEIKKEYINLLSFVSLKDFTIDFDEKDMEEYRDMVIDSPNGYVFKNHAYLYSFLISELKFNDVDFILIKNLITNSQVRLRTNYEQMLKKEIDLGNKKEDASEAFMILRCAFELNRPPIFPENKGKCISEMSLREFLAQRFYISRKCEIEKIQYEIFREKSTKLKT